ncbi:hypothetical protein YC2023_045414 [Brassica napus]
MGTVSCRIILQNSMFFGGHRRFLHEIKRQASHCSEKMIERKRFFLLSSCVLFASFSDMVAG